MCCESRNYTPSQFHAIRPALSCLVAVVPLLSACKLPMFDPVPRLIRVAKTAVEKTED